MYKEINKILLDRKSNRIEGIGTIGAGDGGGNKIHVLHRIPARDFLRSYIQAETQIKSLEKGT